MNVFNGGGPIIAFRDSWSRRNEIEPDGARPEDTEWIDYCRARELAERAAAKKASSCQARRVHQELAQAYTRMIRRART